MNVGLLRLNNKSRMSRPAQVRFCERQRGKFLLPTRLVIHCSSKEQAEQLLAKLKERMQQYELELHPEKTKIVYCKNYQRNEKHDNNSFAFLSYSFQPRTIKSKFGNKRLLVFNADISQSAKISIRGRLKEVLRTRWSHKSLEWFADVLNPKIRGWMNYYTKFYRYEANQVFSYLNELIRKWIKNTYKIRSKGKLFDKYRLIQTANPEMFYHWKMGVK